MDGKTRVPAYGMVFLPQNLSTGNEKIAGCSSILSVATLCRPRYMTRGSNARVRPNTGIVDDVVNLVLLFGNVDPNTHGLKV